MKKKMFKLSGSIISLALTIVMIMYSFPVLSQNEESLSEKSSITWQNKIEPILYEKATQKGGKYLVCIQNEPVATDVLYETIKKETRFNASLYETDKFDSCIVPELERKIIASEQINQVQSPLTNLVLGDPSTPTLKQAKQNEMDAYIKAKRDVIKALNCEKNDLFVEKYIADSSDIAYQSQYASIIFAYLTKEEIEKCARLNETTRIMACPKIKPVIDDIDRIDQIDQFDHKSASSTNYWYSQINSVDSYTGEGIKIGVLEWGRYDETHPQLVGLGERLSYVGDLSYNGNAATDPWDKHATYVTALIVGKSIEVDGEIYAGMLPNATVYQTTIENNEYGIVESIELLLNCNVTVINCSSNIEESDSSKKTSYSFHDDIVDQLLSTVNATLVVAAGNEGRLSGTSTEPAYVVGPGKAYNAITVGNAKTNDLSGNPISAPYSMGVTSSYEVADYLTNKPDISAPGCFIKIPYVKNTGEIDVDYMVGTSYAAPLVTSVVAQMHEANVSLQENRTATKAALLAGADFDAISGNNNDLWEYCYAARVKSGVGFLNAERAVRIAEAGNYDYNVYFLNITSRYVEQSIVCEEVYIPANHKIRVVMTYSKPAGITDVETFANGNDMDLDLFYQDRTWCDSSLTPYNNVEVVEYVVDTAGTYSIEVYVPKLTQSRLGVVIHRTVAWCIEPVS